MGVFDKLPWGGGYTYLVGSLYNYFFIKPMSQFEMGPGKKPDPSKPIESGTTRYSHGGTTQEGRERSAREAGDRLSEDLKARRTELVRNLGVNMSGKELVELRNIMMQTQGNLGEQERKVIWDRIQAIEQEKRKP